MVLPPKKLTPPSLSPRVPTPSPSVTVKEVKGQNVMADPTELGSVVTVPGVSLNTLQNVGKPATPFHKHSLRGEGEKLLAKAIDTKPLIGEFLMFGQSSVVYAKPNAGKTLCIMRLVHDAVEEGRVNPDDVIYVNADDSGKGLAEKVSLLESIGVHMLAPNYKGFRASQFMDQLKQSAEDGSARGRVIIIDTLKKFTNLMDKGRSSEFAQVCREFVMMGGTIIALGHTAKTPNADGSPRYQGTTDILEDFDAGYVAEAMSSAAGADERIIRFKREKSRADSPEIVGYAYSNKQGLTYAEKLASVRPVYPEELEGHALEFDQLKDEEVISLIRSYLAQGQGHVGLDKMVKAMAANGDVSRAQAHRIVERYTGSDPEKHLWNFDKGARGKRTYYLLKDRPSEGATTPTP